MNEDTGAKLERIQGGVNLINERLLSATHIAEERHTAVRADISDLRQRQNGLGSRVGILEADRHTRDGERKGLLTGGKFAWTVFGTMIGSGGILGLLKLFGAL